MLINTPYRDGIAIPLTIAAGVTIAEGELVAVNADGNAVPATDASAKYLMGRAELSVSPELPAPNNAVIVTRNRQFLLANDASTPVTAADIGSDVVLTAQNTVGKVTAGDAAALGVGVLMGVDYNGQVWVEIGGAPLGMLGDEL